MSPILPGPGFAPGAILALTTSVTLLEEYTDNFHLFEEEAGPVVIGPTRDGKVSNFRTTLSAGATLAVNAARTKGYISAGLSVAHDTAPDGLSAELFPSLAMVLLHELTPRLTLTLTDTFSKNDDSFRGDPFGIRRQRAIYTSNDFSAALSWLLDRIQTQIYYRNSVFFSEDTDFVQGNNTTTVSNIVGASAGFPIGLAMSGIVGYEFSITNTSGDIGGEEPQTLGNLVFGQISRRISEFASVGLSGSYQTFTAGQGDIWNISAIGTYGLPSGWLVSGSVGYSQFGGIEGQETQGTVTTQTQISYVFPRGAAVSVGFFSDFRQTFQTGQDFGVVLTRSYFGTFSYPITQFLTGSLFVSYSENEFTGVGNTRSDQPLNALTVTASLAYPIFRWLSASAGYNYTRYTGGRAAIFQETGIVNISGGPITENRVYVSLSASF